MAPTVLSLYAIAITNEKTKIDANRLDPTRLLRFPAETRSNNSGKVYRHRIPYLIKSAYTLDEATHNI